MLNSQEFQQGIQAQQLVSNAGQQAITNETQGRVGDDGRERAQVLSAAQKAQEQANLGKTLATYALTNDGKTSILGNLFSNNQKVTEIAKSVAQQSRLKGLA
jgi:hypothetical protein